MASSMPLRSSTQFTQKRLLYTSILEHTNTHPVNCKIYSIHLNKYISHCSNLHVIKASLAFYGYCAYFRKTENILYDSLIMEILCFGTLKSCGIWNRWWCDSLIVQSPLESKPSTDPSFLKLAGSNTSTIALFYGQSNTQITYVKIGYIL